MRVLYLTNNPNLGSTARILQSWILRAKAVGLDTAVVAQRPGAFADWLKTAGVVHRVDPMPWPSRRWPIPALRHAWAVARWARRLGVDVIHCNEHDVYPFGVLLRRLLRRPIVCHVRFRVGRDFCQWAFANSRCPDALLWTSHQQREDCASAIDRLVPDDRQHIVRLGIDLSTFGTLAAGRAATRAAWGVRPDEIVIGTASALRPIKRIHEFITLIDRLAREDDRVVGVVAGGVMPGDESYRDGLVRQVADAGLGRRFRWLGNLDDVEPFYHATDVFVSTSEYETFGNSVCEAMACGKPVAGYAGGSVPEVVGPAGRMVPVGDLDRLTAAVRGLLADPDLRADYGRRGRERVAGEFDPGRSLETTRALYTSLTNRTLRVAR
jgi:glycosyltransferase involved in cell wall biosynthesis